MSKSVVRVVLSVLIALGIMAGVYTSVMGASLHAGARSGQVHVDAGLMPDLRQRHAVQKLEVYLPQTERSGHHCDDEAYNPSDD